MKITDFEKKRASNLIWNGAHDYSAEVGFRVYDKEGKADIYWNTIVGIIHRRYDWDSLMDYYNSFDEKINQSVYQSLFWIGLENGAFLKERNLRPALSDLRRAYASDTLKLSTGNTDFEDSAGQRLLAITRGHLRRCMGLDAALPDQVDIKLLDAIELPGELDTKGSIERIDKTLKTFFPYTSGPHRKTFLDRFHLITSLPSLFFRKRRSAYDDGLDHLSFGLGEKAVSSGKIDQSHISVSFAKYTAQTDQGMKEYIREYFGKAAFTETETRDLEKRYCRGNHQDVRLFFTRGEDIGEPGKESFATKMHKMALRQAEINKKTYKDNEALNRIQIDKLTERIRNSLLVRMEDQRIGARSGRIRPEKVWRAMLLNDDRIFKKTIPGDQGNLSVDLLLDGSTSQVRRTEIVSAQGYMIAEALSRCDIPVRVASFCSISGYTVFTIYRDYSEKDKNTEIFRFSTSGANRDGIAVRVAAGLMSGPVPSGLEENHADHRILIILSDATPNDMIKIRTFDGDYRNYAAETGVKDTAEEVHQARLDGISVLCVFTGEDRALPDVRRIYGQDFTRIRDLNMFSDAVGSMLLDRIAGY